MAPTLESKSGPLHFGKRPEIGQSPIVFEIVFFLSTKLSDDSKCLIESRTKGLDEEYQITRRSTVVVLATDDKEHHEYLSEKLRSLMTEKLPKVGQRITHRLRTKQAQKQLQKFCIVADETTTHIVKDMLARPNTELHRSTVGVIFLKSGVDADGPAVDLTRRFSDTAQLQKVTESFDELILDPNFLLAPVTWVVTVNGSVKQNSTDYKQSLEAAFDAVAIANRVAVREHVASQLSVGPLISRKKRKELVKSVTVSRTHGRIEEYTGHQQPSIDRKTKQGKLDGVHMGLGTATSLEARKQGPLCGTWGTSHQMFERLSFVQIGDLKAAQRDIEAALDASPSPKAMETIRLQLDKHAVQLYLGQWKSATDGLLQALKAIEAQRQRQPKHTSQSETIMDLKNNAAYWSAEALICQGDYKRANQLLKSHSTAENLYKLNTNDPLLRRRRLLRAIHTQRLQALSEAGLGGVDDNANDKMGSVKSMIEKLSRSEPSMDGDIKLWPLECQIAVLMTDFARSKLQAMRGDYQQSLQGMDAIIASFIHTFGESHPWTLEAAVFTSQLLVYTSQVEQARALAEKALGIVSGNFGLHHPLSLEALGVLVGVAQATGQLLQGITNASNISDSIGSDAELMKNYPLLIVCKIQLGILQTQSGHYKSAEFVLQSAYKDSVERWPKSHPTLLKVQSALSLAQFHLGKIGLARSTVIQALSGQLRTLHGLAKGYLLNDGNSVTDALFWMIRDEEIYQTSDIGRNRDSEKHETGDKRSKRFVHPDILASILNFSMIERKFEDNNFPLLVQLPKFVHAQSQQQLGACSGLAMDACLLTARMASQVAARNDGNDGNDGASAEDGILRTAYEQLNSLVDSALKETLSERQSNNGDSRPRHTEGHKISLVDPTLPKVGKVYPPVLRACHELLARKTNEPLLEQQPEQGDSKAYDTKGDAAFTMDLSALTVGNVHPTILRACHELITLNTFYDDTINPEYDDLAAKKTDLIRILRLQERSLGRDHPDRLETLLTLVTFHLACNDKREEMDNTVTELSERLRKDDVVEQRPTECLFTRESLMRLLSVRADWRRDELRELFQTLRTDIKEELEREGDSNVSQALQTLSSECEKQYHELGALAAASQQQQTALSGQERPSIHGF